MYFSYSGIYGVFFAGDDSIFSAKGKKVVLVLAVVLVVLKVDGWRFTYRIYLHLALGSVWVWLCFDPWVFCRMPSWELSVGDSVELAAGAPDNGCLGLGAVGSICTVADE